MNSFIAWDKEKNKFMGNGEIIFYDYGETRIECIPNNMDYIGDSTHDRYDSKRWEVFQDIGLKDVTCNPIYANCSIMECYIDQKKQHVFCTYVLEKLAYHFFLVDLYPLTIRGFDSDKVVNLRVVDTIQENKLGLLK